MIVEPVILTGNLVRLEPLIRDHALELAEAGSNPSIWKFMIYGEVTSAEKMTAWIDDLLLRKAQGTDQPFAVRHLPSGKLAGATRFMEIRPQHRSLEIGGTWYGLDYQRTGVNTETKYLLLKYAFESLGCIRVQLKADSRNQKSLDAIERLGAVREGTLRNHMILADGVIRHSVFFSIISEEWPMVKEKLESKLKSKPFIQV